VNSSLNSKRFFSKILLFGEYSVIRNSMALAIPYELFFGEFNFANQHSLSQKVSESNGELKNLLLHLKHQEEEKALPFNFDFTSFEFDVGQGLFFLSTIPSGYGVGSSGALTAALYDRYVLEREQFALINDEQKIIELKNHLSLIEAYFHGKSSGVDPLLSYLNAPLLLKSNNKISKVVIPQFAKNTQGAFFILNTNRALSPTNNRCIESFLDANHELFLNSFIKLSQWQFENFSPMIPSLYKNLWAKGQSSELFYLKLCGAGGGGFFLGYAPNFELAKHALKNQEVRILYKF
jgi:mevalonate kinase